MMCTTNVLLCARTIGYTIYSYRPCPTCQLDSKPMEVTVRQPNRSQLHMQKGEEMGNGVSDTVVEKVLLMSIRAVATDVHPV